LQTAKTVEDTAYRFNPIAGAGMSAFNLLAAAFSAPADEVLGETRSYASCSFSAREIKGWKRASEPTGVERVPNASETLWYQSGDAMLQVLCIPKSASLEAWGQGTLDNLPPRFDDFVLLGQESFAFKGAPAHWFAYRGRPKGFTQLQRGYMVIVDRGDTGLVISVAVPDEAYEKHAAVFRAAVEGIQLHAAGGGT
jgi:hypothetical protein